MYVSTLRSKGDRCENIRNYELLTLPFEKSWWETRVKRANFVMHITRLGAKLLSKLIRKHQITKISQLIDWLGMFVSFPF